MLIFSGFDAGFSAAIATDDKQIKAATVNVFTNAFILSFCSIVLVYIPLLVDPKLKFNISLAYGL
jgi:hypothetical protein